MSKREWAKAGLQCRNMEDTSTVPAAQSLDKTTTEDRRVLPQGRYSKSTRRFEGMLDGRGKAREEGRAATVVQTTPSNSKQHAPLRQSEKIAHQDHSQLLKTLQRQ